ncbi:uncharacterized protein LOC142528314 [Primulina tabacum]|uniref:uncharacterized protein LOC142528314 n=1 Tax=Primulina tabacum TaxID=48773 RepID=UPI003F59B754
MRKVIYVDGIFLKCKYKGCLLVATAQDGDFHQFPIAWAIVDSENDDSWNWFLQKLKEFINDDPNLVIISDRHVSIINVVRTVYEHASHVHCSWHLSQNLKRVSGGKAYSPGARYNLMTTNGAILRANFTLSQRLKAYQLNAFEYQVYGDGKDEVVNLSERSCSCRVFQIDKIPYAHAIAVIYGAKLDLYDFCSPYYSSQMWAFAYADTIYPVPIANEWNIPDHFKYNVLPPDVKMKRGRAQKERIPSIGEFGRKRTKKCGVCHESGHCRKNALRDRLMCRRVVQFFVYDVFFAC